MVLLLGVRISTSSSSSSASSSSTSSSDSCCLAVDLFCVLSVPFCELCDALLNAEAYGLLYGLTGGGGIMAFVILYLATTFCNECVSC